MSAHKPTGEGALLYIEPSCSLCARTKGQDGVRLVKRNPQSMICTACILEGVIAAGIAGVFPFKKMLKAAPYDSLEMYEKMLKRVVPESPADAVKIERDLAVLRKENELRYRLRKD